MLPDKRGITKKLLSKTNVISPTLALLSSTSDVSNISTAFTFVSRKHDSNFDTSSIKLTTTPLQCGREWRLALKGEAQDGTNHNPVAYLLSGQKVQQQPRTHRCYGVRGSAPNPNYLSTMILQMGIKSHSQIVVEILTGYRANRDFDVEWTCPSGGFIFKGQLNRATRRRIFTGFQNRA